MLSGCKYGAQRSGDAAADMSFKVYKLRGKIVSTNAANGEVTVNHEAIPGFMEAMTMAYKLKDANILSELHPGDIITADLDVPQGTEGDVVLDHIVVVGQGKPDYKPAKTYHVPTAGDVVPEFRMKNQDDRTISLHQFRGKNVLITFIYTRCPLPNFCPRVTHEFADIQRAVLADPQLAGKTHLICVSFDPENDTPQRLRAYGAQYIGSDAKTAFQDWDFAVPDKVTLEKMGQFFDVGFSQEADQSITHTLSTTLIGPDGKVVQFYPGNEWTVSQVMSDLKHSVARS